MKALFVSLLLMSLFAATWSIMKENHRQEKIIRPAQDSAYYSTDTLEKYTDSVQFYAGVNREKCEYWLKRHNEYLKHLTQQIIRNN